LGGGTGHAHREESVGVEGGDVGVVAEVASIHASPVKGVSTVSVSKSPKTRSPTKIGDIGADPSAFVGQVSPRSTIRMSSIAEPLKPTKLLIFKVIKSGL
jgi:hypothetical protein